VRPPVPIATLTLNPAVDENTSVPRLEAGTELCRRADVERLCAHVGKLAGGRGIEAFASLAHVESAIS